MTIAAAASAFPPHEYDQRAILLALQRHWGPKVDNPIFIERLQARVGVEKRHLALPIEEYYELKSWGRANNHWIDVAQEIGETALCRALARAGLHPSDLDALFFVSITGISCPSIDVKLVNRMGLPAHLKRTPIFGLGCVAGAVGLSRAADYVRAFPDQVAAVLAVELCSLTLQQEDTSIANIISSGLFGDGAAAVLVIGEERGGSGPAILATRSVLFPDSEHVLGWDISEKGFRMVLARELPEIVQQKLGPVVDQFLAEQDLSRADIGNWILHTGGPRVLEATAAALGLEQDDIAASWECLRRDGNLSSASVLVVLEETMLKRRPPAGTYGLLAAMGPGFSAELLLLRW
ncbi:MAG TPA: 3-oxoacyl-[acyl-carrier-protein] synthase III C-terminal domain-containing protein [Bryobacteraceae bacterium]|nr:3-oxoacyl-[acyl-carrier-protein] synthase III C-terminal domain-containing protein [Bryobacteraceae bacterium]